MGFLIYLFLVTLLYFGFKKIINNKPLVKNMPAGKAKIYDNFERKNYNPFERTTHCLPKNDIFRNF